MSSEESTAVVLARIEGKLDLLHAGIQQLAAQGADHEGRIRALESRPPGITPAKFLSTVVGLGSLAAGLASVVTLVSR